MTRLDRQGLLDELKASVADFKVTVLLGLRRSGKTSLARSVDFPEENFFDLEDPMDQARLENPEELLDDLRGLVVIDEIQRQPDLIPGLLEIAKSWGGPSRILLVGSGSPALSKEIAEITTTGLNVVQMSGLSGRETGAENRDQLWLRGGFPESYFAASDEDSLRWRRAFVETVLRRDFPSIGIQVPPERMRRFWISAAERHAQPWNSSLLAASAGISHPTARSYLNLFTETFMLRQLQPLVSAGRKRTVKAPKVYVRDSGLLHGLLEIDSKEALESGELHERSWEGFALEQLASVLGLKSDELFFWATHGGAEMDLVVERDGRRFGFEFKLTDKPGVTHSMTIAKEDLSLDMVYLVYPGERSFPLREGMEALGYAGIAEFSLP